MTAPAGIDVIELAPFWAFEFDPNCATLASLPVEMAVHNFSPSPSGSIRRYGPSRIILAHHSGQTSSEQGTPAICGTLLSVFGQIHVPLGP
ncbi:MAG: hypothetical protein WHS82_01325 [Candidatus Methanosuratincola sp.]